MSACEPSKAFPVIASMLSDKDSQVRKSALGTLRWVHHIRTTLSFSHNLTKQRGVRARGRKGVVARWAVARER